MLVVAGICIGLEVINNGLKDDIDRVQAQIEDPVLVNDNKIVDLRTTMLQGFESYNASMEQTSLLFNYQPKVQSYVVKKFREPIDNDDKIISSSQRLDVVSYSINGSSVEVNFRGVCLGDPSAIPSAYVEYLTEKVTNKYGDPYFANISYSGFTKDNSSDEVIYAILSKNGETDIDTVFSFNVSMNLNMGSDENNATINLNPDDEQEEGAELNEAE